MYAESFSFRCHGNLSTAEGRIYQQSFTYAQLLVSMVILISYGMIGVYMKRSAKQSGNAHNKYLRSTKVMLIFVLVFIFQWWPLAVFAIWAIFAVPHLAILIICVTVINLGGVYNAIAYVFLRTHMVQAVQSSVGAKRGQSHSYKSAIQQVSTISI